MRATSKQQDDRYQSAEELLHAFWQAVGVDDEVMVAASDHDRPTMPLSRLPAPATIRLELPPCPYRGLFAFRAEDAPLFFGRDAVIDDLVQAVEQQSAVVVIGPSGSGKSSVVAAGLLPRLQQAAHLRQAQGIAWSIASMRPSDRPFHAFAAAMLSVLERELETAERLRRVEQMAQELADGTQTLRQLAEQVVQQHPDAPYLLLVIDQFEELYTLCPDAHLRQQFLDGLLDAIAAGPAGAAPLTLLLTLRADFVGQVVAYRPMADLLHSSAFILGPMNRNELAQAIGHPAQKLGVPFEDGLIERILDEIGNEPGTLPLLEFALTLLWERHESGILTHAGYEAIGHVEGALARYADHVYDSLTAAEQTAARRIIIQLVRPGEGTEDTRRVATVQELVQQDRAVVQRLADARLVVTGRDSSGVETIEVAHEALIRGWQRLQEWMQADRVFREWQERVRAALRQWERSGRDEGALLRGAPLAEAEAWLRERGGEISQQERDYIETSGMLRERERQRVMRGTIAAVIVLLLLLAFTGWQWWRADENAQTAAAEANQRATVQAQQATEIVLRQTAEAAAQQRQREAEQQAQIAHSRQLAAQSTSQSQERAELALLLALQADNIASTTESRNQVLDGLRETQLAATLRNHTARVQSVAWRADDRMLASASADTTIRLWQMEPGQAPAEVVQLHGHTSWVNSIAWRADGAMLASASADGTVRLWQINDGQEEEGATEVAVLDAHTDAVNSIAWRADDRMLASAGCGASDGYTCVQGEIILWQVADDGTAVEIARVQGHTKDVTSVAWQPAGRLLASAARDGSIHLWQVAEGQSLAEIATLPGQTGWVLSVAWRADGRMLAAALADGSIQLWQIADNQPPVAVATLQGHANTVTSIAWQAAGNLLASGAYDGTVRVWQVAEGQTPTEIAVLQGHTDAVNSVAWQAGGRMLATGADDDTVRLWHVVSSSPAEVATLHDHTDWVTSVAWRPDGRMLASGSEDGTVRLWQVAQGRDREPSLVAVLRGHQDGVRSIAWRADGRVLASGADDGTVRLWQVTDNREPTQMAVLHGHIYSVMSVAWRPDGRTLASGSYDGTVRLWQVEQGQEPAEIASMDSHTSHVLSVAWSADGRMLASGSFIGIVKIWQMAAHNDVQEIASLQSHTAGVTNLAWQANDRMLASSSTDGTVRLWQGANAPQSAEAALLHSQTAGILSVAWRADDRMLASASDDNTVRIWQTQAGTEPTEIARLQGHTNDVTSVAWQPGGTLLASGSRDGSVRLWIVDRTKWKESACRAVARNMTWQEWHQYIGNVPYRRTCNDFPMHASVVPEIEAAGEQLARAGHIISATQQFSAALRLNPTLVLTPATRAKQAYADALVAEGTQLARAGHIISATQQLSAALQLNPTLVLTPVAQARQTYAATLVVEGTRLVREGHIISATRQFSAARRLAPGPAISPTLQAKQLELVVVGEQLAQVGHIISATQQFSKALAVAPTLPISADSWNILCWYGSLWEHADEVLYACERAVAQQPAHGGIRDSRGIARALLGDDEGAVDDFTFFVTHVARNPYNTSENEIVLRKRWITSLQRGENPFTREMLRKMRGE